MSTVVGTERRCPDERLIELAQGRLRADEAQALEAHVTSCAVCARELRWLSAERSMFAAHAQAAPGLPAAAWDKIAARTVAPRPAARPVVRRPGRWAWGLGLAAAAASVAFVALGGLPDGRRSTTGTVVSTLAADASVAASIDGGAPGPVEPTRAVAALDAADRELDDAIGQLQADYQRRRGRLPAARARRYDEEFTTALSVVEKARSAAGQDVAARRQVVRARARYLRSIQTVVLREGRS